MFGKEIIKSLKLFFTSDFLGDVASEVRAKSSFCGFKGSQGSGAITFDSITSDNNVNGAAINPEAGTVTIGADASYQVYHWTMTHSMQVSVSLQMKTEPGSYQKLWIAKNGEKQVDIVWHHTLSFSSLRMRVCLTSMLTCSTLGRAWSTAAGASSSTWLPATSSVCCRRETAHTTCLQSSFVSPL